MLLNENAYEESVETEIVLDFERPRSNQSSSDRVGEGLERDSAMACGESAAVP